MGDAGSLLVRAGLIEREALEAARAALSSAGGTLAEQLVLAGAVEDETLTQFYRDRLLVPRVSDSRLHGLESRVIAKIPGDMAVELRVVPVSIDREGSLTVAMSDPSDTHAVDELSFFSGHFVVRAVASQRQIAWCLAHYYGYVTDLGSRLLDDPPAAEVDPELLATTPYLKSKEALPPRRRRITDQVEAARKRVVPPSTVPPLEAERPGDVIVDINLKDWERALEVTAPRRRDTLEDLPRLDGEASASGVIEAKGPAKDDAPKDDGDDDGDVEEIAVELEVDDEDSGGVEIAGEAFELDAELPEPGEAGGGAPLFDGSPPELAPRSGEVVVHRSHPPSVGASTPRVVLDEALLFGTRVSAEEAGAEPEEVEPEETEETEKAEETEQAEETEEPEEAAAEKKPAKEPEEERPEEEPEFDEQTDPTRPLPHLRHRAASSKRHEAARSEEPPAEKPRRERGTESAPFLLSELKRDADEADESADAEPVLLLEVPKKRAKRQTALGIGVPATPRASAPGSSPPAPAAESSAPSSDTIDWGDSTKLRRLITGLEYEAARPAAERASSPPPEVDDEGAARLLDTLEAIHAAAGRDAIVTALLDYLDDYCERVVFLALRGGALEPWQIRRGTAPADLPDARLPLKVQSMLRDIVDTRLSYRGPLEDRPSRDLVDQVFGEGGGDEALVVPVAVRGRVVGLLYAGGIGAALENHHIGLVTQAAGRALERILRRKKTET